MWHTFLDGQSHGTLLHEVDQGEYACTQSDGCRLMNMEFRTFLFVATTQKLLEQSMSFNVSISRSKDSTHWI